MLHKKRESLEWLEFELLQPFPVVRHAIFLRHGGVSHGPFATLNAGGGSGDDLKSIQVNRERMRKALGCSGCVSGRQVHGAQVELVPLENEDTACDGLVTQQTGVGLLIKHADCQAAVFYDPRHQAIGCVHAGWRGNVRNIYAATVEKMEHCFGTSPADLFVGISPSLGPCCGEFIHYRKELPEQFWEFQEKPLYFNLWEISRSQLLAAGVLPHHIEIAQVCTRCNPQDYFSYRREKQSGRHGTIVSLQMPS